MNKADCELEFVQHIKSVGVETWCKTYDRGRWYYCFWLHNGETRYWTNLSDENANILGLNDRGEE